MAPDRPVSGTFGGVTVLTHGFELIGLVEDSDPFKHRDTFKELGKMITVFGGGGIVLLYDKTTGQWTDLETGQVVAGQGLAAYAGQQVVLVADWVKDSVIADGGFAEAAADAMFASIMALDEQAGGALLGSPMHFIGHSRGASVNSEIIQRLGWYRPDVQAIHMTTLDPHDFDQPSLNVPLGALTAFHESQRIDRQLYGRAGRQGDPGSAEAFSALDEELYRYFAPGPAKLLGRSCKEWPLQDGAAEWVRQWAQGAAERRHAAARRLTELSEETLRKTIAFSGSAE